MSDVMFDPGAVVERSAHPASAAYLMQSAKTPALIVVDDQASRTPVTMITARDIVRSVAHGSDASEERVGRWQSPSRRSSGPRCSSETLST